MVWNHVFLSDNYIVGTSLSREGGSTSPADADLEKFPSSFIQDQAGFSESPSIPGAAGGQILPPAETPPAIFQGWQELQATRKLSVKITRTSHTHCYKIKRMCKPYNRTPYSARFHKATDSTAVTMCGQETESLSHELESDNIRQVGVGRISKPLHQPTNPGALAKPSYILRRAKLIAADRGEHSIREGCYHPGAEPSSSREFLFNPVSCSQERRSDETSHQPQKIERLGGTPALQDGYGDTQGAVEDERLDGEGRSQRRLLHHPNTYRSSTFLKVQSGSTTLPVHLPTIRPVLCPMGVHQGDETPCHPPTEYGGTYDSLYRRHTADGRVHQSGRGSSGSPDILANRSGLCHQHTQVDHNPHSTD